MIEGFETKEDIRSEWEDYLGNETSDFSTGSERIYFGYLTNLVNLILHQSNQTCFLKHIMHLFT